VLAVHGQDRPADEAQERYLFSARHFGVKDGLAHRRVSSLAVDHRGYLWMATPAGVVRWDGYGFVNHTQRNGLTRDGADQVACDGDGFIWVHHDEGGLDILDPLTGRARSFRDHFAGRLPALEDGGVTGLSVANDGTVVFAQGGRLVRYRTAQEGFQHTPLLCTTNLFPYKVEVAGAAWCICSAGRRGWNAGELIRVDGWPNGTSGPGPNVARIGGVYNVFQEGHDLLDTLPRPSTGVDVLLGRTSGRVLPTLEVVDRDDAATIHTSGIAMEAGMVRMRLTDGLWLLNTQLRRMHTGDDPQHAELLFDIAAEFPASRFKVHDALRDRLGNVWLATEFGLYQVTLGTDRFQRWLYNAAAKDGLGTSIRGMAVLNGRLLVNTENRGFHVLDARNGTSLFVDTVVPQGLGLHAERDDAIWLGRSDRLERRAAHGVVWTVGLGARLNDVWCMLPVPDDGLLVGTSAGVAFIAKANEPPDLLVGLPHPGYSALDRATVYHLQRDRHGHILACTSAGLYGLDERGGVRKDPAAHGATDGAALLACDIRHLHEDSAGVLWLATATQGLLRWDRTSGVIRTADGLPPGSVHAAYADGLGKLWLPTDNGLVRYDPRTARVHVFTTSDGLAHDEFNRIAHARGPDGRLYFGGLNGITVVDPRAATIGTAARAPLVLDGVHLQADGPKGLMDLTTDVAAGAPITLRPGDRFFTVAVRLLSFEDRALMRYAWRIDGIDADWNIQREAELRFTALPYGTHRLRITAINADGLWSTTELALPIVVQRPFYLQWWFVLLSVAMLVALVFTFVRYREQRLREVMQVRDRIALDLHDEVGSSLSSIVLFSTAVTKGNQGLPDKATALLQRIKENSTRAMESMNDIVWSVDPEHDALSDLLARMRVFAQPICEARGIDLVIDIPADLLTRKLGMAARKNLYLIFKEALINAVRHAGCTRIAVSMPPVKDHLELRVADNGRGMAAHHGEASLGGHGLDNMRKRAAEMHGTLRVHSATGQGTEVVVRFPNRSAQ
jgi:signal transduction histidine kinase/streptogramin lyase